MISVYLLLDLCPSPCLCLFLPPAQTPAPPQTPARPRLPSVPVPDLPGDGNGRRCRPGVRRGTVGRRNGAEVFPECAPRHRWATELDVSAARACVVVLLGDGTGQKCRPSVW